MEEKNQKIQKAATIEQVKMGQRLLRKKSMMLMLTGTLTVVVLAALTIAWYTRVANTYAVTFDVADYDLTMNENVENEYLLNVYDYSQVTNKKMAPGTIGWIPLVISAYHSDVEVDYFISLDSKMPADLRNHIRFFVLKDKTTEKYVYDDGNGIFSTVAKLDNDNYTKVPLTPSYNNVGDATVVTDSIRLTDANKTKTLYIFWEWFWDADTAAAAGVIKKSDYDSTQWNQIFTAWNDLDTDVGRYPDKYYDAFTVYIKTMGSQVRPADGTATRPGGGSN